MESSDQNCKYCFFSNHFMISKPKHHIKIVNVVSPIIVFLCACLCFRVRRLSSPLSLQNLFLQVIFHNLHLKDTGMPSFYQVFPLVCKLQHLFWEQRTDKKQVDKRNWSFNLTICMSNHDLDPKKEKKHTSMTWDHRKNMCTAPHDTVNYIPHTDKRWNIQWRESINLQDFLKILLSQVEYWKVFIRQT